MGTAQREDIYVPEADLEYMAWDADAVQSIASVEMSVFGNIALQTVRENPDLVEYISTTDVNVLKSQSELPEP